MFVKKIIVFQSKFDPNLPFSGAKVYFHERLTVIS